MKTSLKVIFFLLISHSSFAQISVKFFNYRPLGDFGFIMNPRNSIELGYMNSFDDEDNDYSRLRTVYSITYLSMKPRLDSFPTVGVLHDGSGTHLIPGSDSFQKYDIFQVFGGIDWAFIKRKNFYVFIGADIIIGAANIDYTSYSETIISEGYTGGGYLGGFRFRIGAEYEISKHVGAFINAERSGWLITEPSFEANAANDFGIGMKYKF